MAHTDYEPHHKKEIIMDTEKQYRAAPGLNYSNLSRFNQSQDHCLMPFEHKSYFEFGHQFEQLLQDACTGSTTFSERFFYCNVDGALPDDLIFLIDSGADLTLEYVYNKPDKKGNRKLSGMYKKRHAFLDAALENPGKIPVSKTDNEKLKIMIENMINMEYLNISVGELLSKAQWQVPVYWEDDQWHKKKALVDCLVEIDGTNYPLDVKTCANFNRFYGNLSHGYWIQALHYAEGVKSLGKPIKPMTFLVASKEAPYLSKPIMIDWNDYKMALNKYQGICSRYLRWETDGRPSKGFLPLERKKIYI
jgi:hypothetical protein